jgi:hypothetical protein
LAAVGVSALGLFRQVIGAIMHEVAAVPVIAIVIENTVKIIFLLLYFISILIGIFSNLYNNSLIFMIKDDIPPF